MEIPCAASLTGAPASEEGEGRPIDEIRTTMNPIAAIIIPIPIFLGVEGSIPFFASHANAPITGNVKATMNSGLNDWKTSGDIEFCALNGVNHLPSRVVGSNPVRTNDEYIRAITSNSSACDPDFALNIFPDKKDKSGN